MEEKGEQKGYLPVYQQTLQYAMEHGAADDYLDSRKLNIDCKKAIEETIREHFDGMRLSLEDSGGVLEQFGMERVSYVLANTLLWSSIFVTLMANKIGGLQFGIYRNCQISSRVFHTAVAALPLTKANRSDFE